MITVLPRNKLNEERYNLLQESSYQSLIYTDLTFLDAIATSTSSKLYFIVDERDESYALALPFCLYFGPIGPVINSLPFFGSNGGAIASEEFEVSESLIIDSLIQFAEEKKCISITVIESPLRPGNKENFKKFTLRDSRISLLNEFHSGMTSDQLMGSFSAPRPRNIRKAISSGIEVKESHSFESIEFLAETHRVNIEAIGGIPKPKDFFIQFLRDLPESKWLILEATLEGRRIASLLLLRGKNVTEYFTPAIISEFRNIQPLSLLIYVGMQKSIENGVHFWNWGGTWHSQSGVYDFKKKWGAKELTYTYYCMVLKNEIKHLSPEFFTQSYPYFYVIPFDYLEKR